MRTSSQCQPQTAREDHNGELPLRSCSGDLSRCLIRKDSARELCFCGGGGGGGGGVGTATSVGVSEYASEEGVSPSGEMALWCTALGGNDGRDLSSSILLLLDCLCRLEFFADFFRRLAINDSWHSMQNIPCDVRAYRRFSIFFLQFRHLKQLAQNAWSPVRMAKSSILLPHALQLYVQLLQMRDPSPRSKRFASESRRVPQVLQRKQSMCQRLPA